MDDSWRGEAIAHAAEGGHPWHGGRRGTQGAADGNNNTFKR
jgi:hypothetical protein